MHAQKGFLPSPSCHLKEAYATTKATAMRKVKAMFTVHRLALALP